MPTVGVHKAEPSYHIYCYECLGALLGCRVLGIGQNRGHLGLIHISNKYIYFWSFSPAGSLNPQFIRAVEMGYISTGNLEGLPGQPKVPAHMLRTKA